MKMLFTRFVLAVLTAVMILTALPLNSAALTKQEQEDYYRTNKFWLVDEFAQKYIDWALNSDNFLYHLDVTEGNIIHDFSYDVLDLNPIERKENLKEILIAIIQYSHDDVNSTSLQEASVEIQNMFFDGLMEMMPDLISLLGDSAQIIADAINTERAILLDYVYVPGATDGQLYYGEILQRIYSRIGDYNVQKEARKALDGFLASEKWTKCIQKISLFASLVSMGINIHQDYMDALIEIAALQKTNEKYVALLKYLNNNTSDPALAAACSELAIDLGSDYDEQLKKRIADSCIENGMESLGISLLKNFISDANLYAKAIVLAYDLGMLASKWLFNSEDIVKHMQTAYCTNQLSEHLSWLVQTELSTLKMYTVASSKASKLASDAIYHMDVLLALRRLGEESYYNLKNSTYRSMMVQAIGKLSWGGTETPLRQIEEWYTKFNEAINIVDKHLFKMIPATHYYDSEDGVTLDIENGRLIQYAGACKHYDLGGDVTTVGAYAFMNEAVLESIEIAPTVTRIEGYAFSGCSRLRSVTILGKDTVIENNAFHNCDTSLAIYGYSGSTAETYAERNGITFYSIDNPYEDALAYPEGLIVDYASEDETQTVASFCVMKYTGSASVLYIPQGITAIGWKAFEGNTTLECIVIPETVTHISSYAFKNCTALTSIHIPASVTEIGTAPFYGCSSLKKITVDENNPYYYSDGNCIIEKETGNIIQGCKGSRFDIDASGIAKEAFAAIPMPESITLTENIHHIGEKAFDGCTTLQRIYISDKLDTMAAGAFFGCTNVQEIRLPMLFAAFKNVFGSTGVPKALKEVTVIGNHDIAADAFKNCDYIEKITVCGTLAIGENAFALCDALREVYIGGGVYAIGQKALYSCDSLEKVYIGGSVSEIPDYLLQASYALKTLQIEAPITRIGAAALNACGALETIALPDTLKEIAASAFSGCIALKEISLPEGLVTIGQNAFGHCQSLTELILPESATSLGAYAFIDLHKDAYHYIGAAKYIGTEKNPYLVLVSFDNNEAASYKIADTTEYIMAYAFADCTKMTDISLPKSLKQIQEAAFYNCDSLATVFYEGTAEDFYKIEIGENNTALTEAMLASHKHNYTNFESTENGTHIAYCECGEKKEEAHGVSDAFITEKDATCTENGSKYSLCPTCNARTETIVIPASHSFEEGFTVDKEASCTEDGEKSRHCKNCKERTDITAIFAAHNWDSDFTVDKAATCAESGKKSRHCKNCDAVTDVTEIFASHEWKTEFTVDKEASCTEDGEKSRHCQNCTERYDITVILAAHTWDNGFTVDKAPTVTESGMQSRHCLACNAKTDIKEIPPLTAESSASDFYYTKTNGSIKISGYLGTSSVMSIPAYIDGIPVTTISMMAFYGNQAIETAIIPYTVTNIEQYAFYGCKKLKTVTINAAITELSTSAFGDCTALSSIILPETLNVIAKYAFIDCTALSEIIIPSSVRKIEECAFMNCTALAAITFPEMLETLGADALGSTPWFNELDSTLYVIGNGILIKLANEFGEDLYIPEGIRSVYADFGVLGATIVETVHLPKTLTCWDQRNLYLSAKAYTVDGESPYLSAHNGVLYNKDGTALIAYPNRIDAAEYTVLNGTKIIGSGAFFEAPLSKIQLGDALLEIQSHAFSSCRDLESISLPESITHIGEYAFESCDALKSVILPPELSRIEANTFIFCRALTSVSIGRKVTYIGISAFSYNALTDVYYAGTKEEFERIEIDSLNGAIQNATIHYAITEVHTHEYLQTEIYSDSQHKLSCECGDAIFEQHDFIYESCEARGICQACGAEGAIRGHSFTVYVSNEDATCEADGTKTAKCDRCDAKDTIPDIGSALGYTEKFKSDVKNVVGIQGSDAYFALYTALETYALLTDTEKAEVSEEYAALCTAIRAYNTTATEVNHIADEATEIALAPLCAAGFSFLAALWLLIQKKFGV